MIRLTVHQSRAQHERKNYIIVILIHYDHNNNIVTTLTSIARAISARGQRNWGRLLYWAHLGYAFDALGYAPAAKPLVCAFQAPFIVAVRWCLRRAQLFYIFLSSSYICSCLSSY